MEGACGCARAETETRERTANPTCDEPDVREVRSSRYADVREMVMLMASCAHGAVSCVDLRISLLLFTRPTPRPTSPPHSLNLYAQVLTGHENRNARDTAHAKIESDSESPGHPRGAVHPIFRRACACEHMPIARCAQ